MLTPCWARRLGRDTLSARQLSPGGGALACALIDDRVQLTRGVVPYLAGAIEIRASASGAHSDL